MNKLAKAISTKDPMGLPLLLSELQKRKKLKVPPRKRTCADTNYDKYIK